MKRLSVALAAVVLAAAGAAPNQALAKTVIVTADRMVDVASGKTLDRPEVVIVDGRITVVGQQGAVTEPAGAERVELKGMTILPGLIDMHVHLDASPLWGGYTGLQFTDSFWMAVGTDNAKRDLMAGFTTVRDVGSGQYDDIGLMQAVEAGVIPGPRIVPVGYAIGSTGGHCDVNEFPPSMKQKGDAVADTPDEGRKMVRTMKKYGAQAIKICATGGVFSHGDTPGAQQMTPETMKAMVDEAHMANLKVAAHAHGASGIREAILAGVDTIEHASLVDDEGIRLAKAKGAYFGMDIYNTDYTQSEGKKNGVLEENLKKDRDIGEIQRQNYKKALKAGVKMIFSTDAGIYPHGDNAHQFATMVAYGATPLQAIQSATLTAAEALGRPEDVGQIAVGRYGDIIAVRGDPLSDVTTLQHVEVVIKGGDVVKR
jgi:imidazolonepropionase-like amidohydrolase